MNFCVYSSIQIDDASFTFDFIQLLSRYAFFLVTLYIIYYQLCGEILKTVNNTTYLGINISNDLKWATHIKDICSKASSRLGFIRRNLQHCPLTTRKNAYLALVRSSLEYGAAIWDPYFKSDIDMIDKIQSRAIIGLSKETTIPETTAALSG